MGNRNSALQDIQIYQPPLNDYAYKQSYNQFKIYQHIYKKHEIMSHKASAGTQSELIQLLQLFKARYQHLYLVSTLYLICDDNSACGGYYEATVFYQRVFTNLSKIKDIPFMDTLHFLAVAFRGFEILHRNFGYFQIYEDMFHIGQDSKVKVWCNKDIARNRPQNYLIDSAGTEQDMIRKIIFIIDQNSDHTNTPFNLKEKLVGNGCRNFAMVNQSLREICRKNNLSVPERVQCLTSLPSEQVEALLDMYTFHSKLQRRDYSQLARQRKELLVANREEGFNMGVVRAIGSGLGQNNQTNLQQSQQYKQQQLMQNNSFSQSSLLSLPSPARASSLPAHVVQYNPFTAESIQLLNNKRSGSGVGIQTKQSHPLSPHSYSVQPVIYSNSPPLNNPSQSAPIHPHPPHSQQSNHSQMGLVGAIQPQSQFQPMVKSKSYCSIDNKQAMRFSFNPIMVRKGIDVMSKTRNADRFNPNGSMNRRNSNYKSSSQPIPGPHHPPSPRIMRKRSSYHKSANKLNIYQFNPLQHQQHHYNLSSNTPLTFNNKNNNDKQQVIHNHPIHQLNLSNPSNNNQQKLFKKKSTTMSRVFIENRGRVGAEISNQHQFQNKLNINNHNSRPVVRFNNSNNNIKDLHHHQQQQQSNNFSNAVFKSPQLHAQSHLQMQSMSRSPSSYAPAGTKMCSSEIYSAGARPNSLPAKTINNKDIHTQHVINVNVGSYTRAVSNPNINNNRVPTHSNNIIFNHNRANPGLNQQQIPSLTGIHQLNIRMRRPSSASSLSSATTSINSRAGVTTIGNSENINTSSNIHNTHHHQPQPQRSSGIMNRSRRNSSNHSNASRKSNSKKGKPDSGNSGSSHKQPAPKSQFAINAENSRSINKTSANVLIQSQSHNENSTSQSSSYMKMLSSSSNGGFVAQTFGKSGGNGLNKISKVGGSYNGFRQQQQRRNFYQLSEESKAVTSISPTKIPVSNKPFQMIEEETSVNNNNGNSSEGNGTAHNLNVKTQNVSATDGYKPISIPAPSEAFTKTTLTNPLTSPSHKLINLQASVNGSSSSRIVYSNNDLNSNIPDLIKFKHLRQQHQQHDQHKPPINNNFNATMMNNLPEQQSFSESKYGTENSLKSPTNQYNLQSRVLERFGREKSDSGTSAFQKDKFEVGAGDDLGTNHRDKDYDDKIFQALYGSKGAAINKRQNENQGQQKNIVKNSANMSPMINTKINSYYGHNPNSHSILNRNNSSNQYNHTYTDKVVIDILRDTASRRTAISPFGAKANIIDSYSSTDNKGLKKTSFSPWTASKHNREQSQNADDERQSTFGGGDGFMPGKPIQFIGATASAIPSDFPSLSDLSEIKNKSINQQQHQHQLQQQNKAADNHHQYQLQRDYFNEKYVDSNKDKQMSHNSKRYTATFSEETPEKNMSTEFFSYHFNKQEDSAKASPKLKQNYFNSSYTKPTNQQVPSHDKMQNNEQYVISLSPEKQQKPFSFQKSGSIDNTPPIDRHRDLIDKELQCLASINSNDSLASFDRELAGHILSGIKRDKFLTVSGQQKSKGLTNFKSTVAGPFEGDRKYVPKIDSDIMGDLIRLRSQQHKVVHNK